MAAGDAENPTRSDSHDAGLSDDEAVQFAQTYRDLAKGEQTASQLEANLTVLESKLEAMLHALETNPETKPGHQNQTASAEKTDTKK
ncbi:hypothetical protein E4U55_002456 [Claviceps digitariae]|nr:hypothetical protein E4U55_002456 [Claviceps digitariae]